MSIAKVILNNETLIDLTGDTAVPADIAQGKTFHLADGTQATGTASGGGGGLYYETGIFEPTENIYNPTISFNNPHTEAPYYVLMTDITGTGYSQGSANVYFQYIDYYKLFGVGMPRSSSDFYYGLVNQGYMNGTGTNISNNATSINVNSDSSESSSTQSARYYVRENNFTPYNGGTSRLWRTGRTYKWIAIWAPTE